jgi:hypothetical protein
VSDMKHFFSAAGDGVKPDLPATGFTVSLLPTMVRADAVPGACEQPVVARVGGVSPQGAGAIGRVYSAPHDRFSRGQLATITSLFPSITMKTPHFRQRLAAWFQAYRPMRWVETLVSDYSTWNPWG